MGGEAPGQGHLSGKCYHRGKRGQEGECGKDTEFNLEGMETGFLAKGGVGAHQTRGREKSVQEEEAGVSGQEHRECGLLRERKARPG